MDRLIVQLEQLTQDGLSQLEAMNEEQVAQFMDQRALLINELMQHEPTPAQKQMYRERIQAILNQDRIFLAKFEQLKAEAQQQLGKLEAGKTQRHAYDHAYGGESMFFDRKK